MYSIKLSSVGLLGFSLRLARFVYRLAFGALLAVLFICWPWIVGVIHHGSCVDRECAVECVQYSSVGPLNRLKSTFVLNLDGNLGSDQTTHQRSSNASLNCSNCWWLGEYDISFFQKKSPTHIKLARRAQRKTETQICLTRMSMSKRISVSVQNNKRTALNSNTTT